jgi:hypothetical protein
LAKIFDLIGHCFYSNEANTLYNISKFIFNKRQCVLEKTNQVSNCLEKDRLTSLR